MPPFIIIANQLKIDIKNDGNIDFYDMNHFSRLKIGSK